jgi:protein phosphatase
MRRATNEDQFLVAAVHPTLTVVHASVAELREQRASVAFLLAVADGMGGEGNGDVASAEAMIALARHVRRALAPVLTHAPTVNGSGRRAGGAPTLPGVRDGLRDAFARCHGRIVRKARHASVSSTMGTTLTAGLLCWPRLYLAHAGDSRCYLLRHDEALQLTLDHTIAAHLAQSGIVPEPSSPLHHVLYNALGGGGHAQHRADVSRVELELGDTILLCSDGITKYLANDDILAIWRDGSNARSILEALIYEAIRRGGHDDITAIVARTLPLAS